MPRYEFDIDMPSDDDEAYDGPGAYLEGDDNISELEIVQDDPEIFTHHRSLDIAQIFRCKHPRCVALPAPLLSRFIYQRYLTFSSCSLAAPRKGRPAPVRTTRGTQSPIAAFYVCCGPVHRAETKMRKRTKTRAMTMTNI